MNMVEQGGNHHGSVVHALHQTRGRGRLGRLWNSGQGNLCLSLIIQPQVLQETWPQLTFVSSLAVAQTALNFIKDGKAIQIKWPNDILINGSKVAGILIDVVSDHVIIGFGINIANAPNGCAYIGSGAEISEVRNVLLQQFEKFYQLWQNDQWHDIKSMWETTAFPIGTPMVTTIKGIKRNIIYDGITHEGHLKYIDDAGHKHTMTAGDIFVEST